MSLNELCEVASWSEALEKSSGYSDPQLVDRLTTQFRDDLAKRYKNISNEKWSTRRCHLVLGWDLSCGNELNSNIADFGGGNGYMFDWIKSTFPSASPQYTVYELPEIANAYQKIESNLGISFLPNNLFDHTLKLDLTILSCTLQYLENWEQLLILALKISRFVLVMRLPLIESNSDRIFIQQPPRGVYKQSIASWPIRYISRQKFLEIIELHANIVFLLLTLKRLFLSKEDSFPTKPTW
jgi:putative methyltransferase (TIGR04325 family)